MVVRDAQDLPRRIADLDGQDAYAVLGVRPDADSGEIAAAYRREMGREHPDRGGSARRAQLVNCAFDVLTRHRDDYDQFLDSQPPGAGPDVISVEPDTRSLDDPLPSVRWPAGAGWGLLVAAVAVFVVVASVVSVAFDRPAGPAPDPETGWTASEVALTADPPSADPPSAAVASAAVASAAVASAAAVAGPDHGRSHPGLGTVCGWRRCG